MFIQSDVPERWESYSNQQLWAAFKQGERAAFSALFLRLYEALFRYGMAFYPNREGVKDGIQELFFRLWQKREQLQVPGSVQSYLFVSLRRILYRDKEKQSAIDKRNEVYWRDYSDKGLDNLNLFEEEQKERQRLFCKALVSLTSRQREALTLRLNHGLTNPEIADIMKISNKRVRNHIYEATKQLKEQVYKLRH